MISPFAGSFINFSDVMRTGVAAVKERLATVNMDEFTKVHPDLAPQHGELSILKRRLSAFSAFRRPCVHILVVEGHRGGYGVTDGFVGEGIVAVYPVPLPITDAMGQILVSPEGDEVPRGAILPPALSSSKTSLPLDLGMSSTVKSCAGITRPIRS